MSESGELSDSDSGKEGQLQFSLKRNMSDRQKMRDYASSFTRRESYRVSYPNLTDANARVLIESRQHSLQFASDSIHPNRPGLGNRIVFFTDGSFPYAGRIGGAGVTYMKFPPNRSLRWIDNCRGLLGVNDATDSELAAIGLALKIAYWEIYSGRDRIGNIDQIYILSDCKLALFAIRDYLVSSPEGQYRRSPKFTRPVFEEVAYNLNRLVSINAYVDFRWVKSHVAARGNIRADRLARGASQCMKNHRSLYDSDRHYSAIRIPNGLLPMPREGRKRKTSEMDIDSVHLQAALTKREGEFVKGGDVPVVIQRLEALNVNMANSEILASGDGEQSSNEIYIGGFKAEDGTGKECEIR